MNNERCFDERSPGFDQPGVTTVEPTAPAPVMPSTLNYYDASQNGLIKQSRVAFSRSKIIKPRVWHPSPYFHSDLMRHNSQCNDHSEYTIEPPQYPFLPQIPEEALMLQHANYAFNNNLGYYHPELNMVPIRRIPADNHINRFMRPPLFAPNDQSLIRYQKEFEQLPQPRIEPYVRNDIHIPPNLHLDYPQQRPIFFDPRMYGYFDEQNSHQMWPYNHMTER